MFLRPALNKAPLLIGPLSLFMYFKLILAVPDVPVSPASETLLLADHTNRFAWDLYQMLVSKRPDENVFFSPASIAVALGMTHLGARNQTAQQMIKVMHLDKIAPDKVHPSFGEFLNALGADIPGLTLHTANKLYTNKNFGIQTAFQQATKNYYKAETESHDFTTDAEGSRQKINEWVESQTNRKIQDLLPEGSIDSLTALLIVNAMYFKGDWKSKFEAELTRNEDFFTGSSRKVTVPLMFQKTRFNCGYNNKLNAHAIKLPYVGERLHLFVILPEHHEMSADPLQILKDLEKQLTGSDLNNVEDVFKMSKQEVRLSLPRFKSEALANLKHHLSEMGMADLFDASKANLSGLDASNGLFVSDVYHKAFIDINEEGSEAAAATTARIQQRSLPRLVEFTANHPFLFFLHDSTTGLVLFMGRLVNPPASAASHTEL